MSEVSAEAIYPMANRLVAGIDAALVKQVLDVPRRQRKSDMHHDHKLDDLRRGFKLAEWVLENSQSPSSKMRRLKVD